MVIKHLENKIRLVGIICTAFLAGCIIISVSSIWTARTMVTDAQKKVYVLDGNVPILVTRTTMDETLDVEAKSHVEMFHHYFFTLAPDDKYIRYTMEKAMYLVDETGLAQYNTLKEKGFYSNILGTSAVSDSTFLWCNALLRRLLCATVIRHCTVHTGRKPDGNHSKRTDNGGLLAKQLLLRRLLDGGKYRGTEMPKPRAGLGSMDDT